jgi:cobalt-precorrin 5A hydrolase
MRIIGIITLNKPGLESAKLTADDLRQIDPNYEISVYHKTDLPDSVINSVKYFSFFKIDDIMEKLWSNFDALIWFVSTGIVIRKIAPLLDHKTRDPSVLVMNMKRTQVIPLLSGHIGGANELSLKLAQVNKNLTPFITTGTDSLKIFAFDTFAKSQEWDILNLKNLAFIANSMINGEIINVVSYSEVLKLMMEKGLDDSKVVFSEYTQDLTLDKSYPTVFITPFEKPSGTDENSLIIKIKPISIGVGLNRGTCFEELISDLVDFKWQNGIHIEDVSVLASFEAKNDEPGLLRLAENLNKNLVFFSEDQINSLEQMFSVSRASEFFNLKGVSEPSAVLSSRLKRLFISKKVYKNTTFAGAF